MFADMAAFCSCCLNWEDRGVHDVEDAEPELRPARDSLGNEIGKRASSASCVGRLFFSI